MKFVSIRYLARDRKYGLKDYLNISSSDQLNEEGIVKRTMKQSDIRPHQHNE